MGNTDIVNMLPTIPEEQILDTWIQTTGGVKKGRVYGLGSEVSIPKRSHVTCVNSHCAMPLSASQLDIPEFEQAVNRILKRQMEDMRLSFREEIEAAVQAVLSYVFTSQPSPNSFLSSSRSNNNS